MKRFLPLLFAFLMFLQPVSAFNALEKLDQNGTYLCICIRGDATLRYGTPPTNPFNDTSIQELFILKPYNKTHLIRIVYYRSGSRSEKIERITEYYPTTMEDVPFKLSDWNLSKVLREYQWGVRNYLPNVTGKHWYKGYWNSSIKKWEIGMNATVFNMTLHGSFFGECHDYITFECWRNGTNVTCKWGKPVFKTHPGPPINGTIPGMDTETTSTTSTTGTNTSSTQTTTSAKGEKKLCGPALLVGLILGPLLALRRR